MTAGIARDNGRTGAKPMCYAPTRRRPGGRGTTTEGQRLAWDQVREFLRVDDSRLWLLIGICVALVFTIQAVEGSVDGVWPHQRRPARMAPGARAVAGVWSYVALLLLPGMLLGALNVAVLLWRQIPHTNAQVLGGVFVGVAWLIFIGVSVNALGLGRFMGQVGPVGPAAMLGVLLVGDVLLLISLLEILPTLDAIREALPSLPGFVWSVGGLRAGGAT